MVNDQPVPPAAVKYAKRTRGAFRFGLIGFFVFSSAIGAFTSVEEFRFRNIIIGYLLGYTALATLVLAGLTFVISALNTASSVILGWRDDVRKAQDEQRKQREFELKIEQLKLQLAEVRAKASQYTLGTLDEKLQ